MGEKEDLCAIVKYMSQSKWPLTAGRIKVDGVNSMRLAMYLSKLNRWGVLDCMPAQGYAGGRLYSANRGATLDGLIKLIDYNLHIAGQVKLVTF